MQEIMQQYLSLARHIDKNGTRIQGQRKYDRMLFEKMEHWAKQNCIKSGNVYTVQTSPGNWVRTDKAGAIELLARGWEDYRASRNVG